MRRISLFIVTVYICTLLSGCWDSVEIDAWAYVYTIGVDKGVDNVLRFTYHIPSMKQSGGKSGGPESQTGSQNEFTVISVDAPTFYSGVNMVETAFSRSINYMHSKYLVISEELAREGVEKFINGMVRSRQVRRTMYVIIVKGKASEFIENFSPALTGAISKAQEGFIVMNHENTGLIIDTSYHDLVRDLKTTYRMPVAPLTSLTYFSNYKEQGISATEFKEGSEYYAGELPRKGGNKFEFIGTALFNGDKMIGELNGSETRVMLMARGDFKRASITIADPADPELRVTIDIKEQKRPEIKVKTQGEKPEIKLKIYLEGDLQNVQNVINYESPDKKQILENSFKKYIKSTLDKTIDKCKNLDVDAFAFGEKAVVNFLTIQEWEKYNWLSRFKDAQVDTQVEFTIRRTGTLLRTNPTRNTQGENQ